MKGKSWYEFALAIQVVVLIVKLAEFQLYPTQSSTSEYSLLDKSKIKSIWSVVPEYKESLTRCMGLLK
jgi:dTDP-4-dehydrorhamnose reductase